MLELFEHTEFFMAYHIKSGRERPGDLGGQLVLQINCFTNTSSSSAIDIRCLSRSTMLLKVALFDFILFQWRNEGIYNIVTVRLELSLRWNNWSDYAPTRIATHTPLFSCSGVSWNAWELFAHQTREFWLLMYTDKWMYVSSVKNVVSTMSSLSRSRKSKNHF